MHTLRHAFLAASLAASLAGCPRQPEPADAAPDGDAGPRVDVLDTGIDAPLDGPVACDGCADVHDAGPPDVFVPANETCAGPFAPCTPSAGTTAFVRVRGTVVPMNAGRELWCDGEVLFSTMTGHIVCAGPDCSASPEAAGAQVICANGVIFPGIIDPHQHTDYNHMPVFQHTARYDNRNTWRNHEPLYDSFKIAHRSFGSTNRVQQLLSERYGEARILMGGGTAISGTAGNLLSDPMIGGWTRNLDSTSNNNSLLGGVYVDPDIDTVLVSSGTGAPNAAMTATHLASVRTRMTTDARYRAYVPHISEGIDLNARLEFDEADRNGVITDHTAIVHCTACSTAQMARIASAGASIIWSPQSNIDLYGQTANVATAHALGVRIALGVDWTPSGSMNPIGELQCAAHLNETYFDRTFTDSELVEMVTVNPAAALRLDDATLPAPLGRLVAGFDADMTVIAGDRLHPYRAMIDARAEQIRLVTIHGQGAYGDTDALAGAVAAGMACVAVPDGLSPAGMTGVCGVAKTVCTQPADIGALTSTLTAALDVARTADTMCSGATPASYCYAYNLFPLFRCGAPVLDRCNFGHGVIARRDVTGTSIAAVSGTPAPGTDDDGDGVLNAMDNCPRVFNPPFDIATTQDDADGDGQGDVCDARPCTRADGTAACVGDVDGDSILDAMDNCPTVANMDQADQDTDGRGDVCDLCPTVSNPAPASCPITTTSIPIPTLRNPAATGHPATGTVVTVSGVVTAVKTAGTNHAFFLQEPTATVWGGVYVFVGPAVPTVAVGDTATATGNYVTFRGLEQVDTTVTGGAVSRTGTGTLPAPVIVADPAEIATGGIHAVDYQSMLLQVNAVTASSATVGTDFTARPAGMCATAGGLVVTSFVASDTAVSPFPATSCQTYTSITGVLYSFGPTAGPFDAKLAPRNVADLVTP